MSRLDCDHLRCKSIELCDSSGNTQAMIWGAWEKGIAVSFPDHRGYCNEYAPDVAIAVNDEFLRFATSGEKTSIVVHRETGQSMVSFRDLRGNELTFSLTDLAEMLSEKLAKQD